MYYVSKGQLPQKKHTAFRGPEGKLYCEELLSTSGFSGIYSTRYRLRMPTRTLARGATTPMKPECWQDAPREPTHVHAEQLLDGGDFLTGRRTLFYNRQLGFSVGQVDTPSNFFFRNTHRHELFFIHHGRGNLRCEYGNLSFGGGDYLIIPKGVTYTMDFEKRTQNRWVLIESAKAFLPPGHYRNGMGQLLEHAPYSERDLRLPEFIEPVDEVGKFVLKLKDGETCLDILLDHHPFDLVGWDGCHYPYAMNIRDFNPAVGKIHLPPSVHAVFSNEDLMVSNFVPRPLDFHENAIPIPYYHSNVDCDEVLYYMGGHFMSRTGVRESSVTLHPSGWAHGPQPGKVSASLGSKAVDEWALMLDTFEPVLMSASIKGCRDGDYIRSWLEGGGEL